MNPKYLLQAKKERIADECQNQSWQPQSQKRYEGQHAQNKDSITYITVDEYLNRWQCVPIVYCVLQLGLSQNNGPLVFLCPETRNLIVWRGEGGKIPN